MGGRIRYTEEFKLGAVAQVTDKGHGVLRKRPQVKYAFIKAHRGEFSVRAMCRVLQVHASSFYAWLKNGLSGQAKRRRRLTGLIKQSWLESSCVYGYRKIHHDLLLSLGERCAANTVAKLMRNEGLRAQVGHKRRPGKYGTKPAVAAANRLRQDFNVDAPDTVWVTDITYIRTHEGWLYFGGRHLPILAQSCGLVYEFTDADIACAQCVTDGCLEAEADEQSYHSFRPRLTVYQPGVAGVSNRSQFRSQYEPPWELL